MQSHTYILYHNTSFISDKKLITVSVVEMLFSRAENILCYLIKKNILCDYRNI